MTTTSHPRQTFIPHQNKQLQMPKHKLRSIVSSQKATNSKKPLIIRYQQQNLFYEVLHNSNLDSKLLIYHLAQLHLNIETELVRLFDDASFDRRLAQIHIYHLLQYRNTIKSENFMKSTAYGNTKPLTSTSDGTLPYN